MLYLSPCLSGRERVPQHLHTALAYTHMLLAGTSWCDVRHLGATKHAMHMTAHLFNIKATACWRGVTPSLYTILVWVSGVMFHFGVVKCLGQTAAATQAAPGAGPGKVCTSDAVQRPDAADSTAQRLDHSWHAAGAHRGEGASTCTQRLLLECSCHLTDRQLHRVCLGQVSLCP